MTQFDDMFENAFADLLILHGETVVYRKPGGKERTITAIVDRDPPAIFNAAGDVALAPSVIIRVHDDATNGIAASEIEFGGDTVDVVIKKGQPATEHAITKLIDGDGGVTQLAIR